MTVLLALEARRSGGEEKGRLRERDDVTSSLASFYQSRVVATVGRERDHDLWLYFVQKEERKGKEKDDRPRSSNSWAQLSSLVPKDLLAHRLVQPELPIVSLVLCKKKNERDVS